MKKLLTLFVILAIITIIAGIGGYSWFNSRAKSSPCSAEDDSTTMVEFRIVQGESVQEISVNLQKAGLISSSDIFYWYVKINRIGNKFQAGSFLIQKCLPMSEIAEILQNAKGDDVTITITEGLRIDEIADVLDGFFLNVENSNFDRTEFLNIVENPDNYDFDAEILSHKPEGASLEGFLLPETYYVSKEISTWEVVNLLVKSLESKLTSEGIDITSHPDLSAYEVLTLASIIERESRSTEERHMIADIFLRRLTDGIDGVKLLDADATLLYELKDWEAVVTIQLKESDSPYNTYKFPGLPPTPIANSRIDSINAVLNPTANEYFFYLHDDEGKIHYAKNLTQQTNNQRCYINKNLEYCL